jgi:transposase
MEEISTVGIDIAKSVFQVHAIDVGGDVVVRRQLRRQQMLKFFARVPPCLIGIEACGTAHYWARELSALGHDARLMPPAYVKPYVKRQKNDAADAEAICEAVTRPTMRFVPVKSVEQQSAAMLHRSRALLIKQRTMLLHSIRAHLAELGISIGVGISQMVRVVRELAEGERSDLPELARFVLEALAKLVCDLAQRLQAIEKKLISWHYKNDLSNRLETIPGVGFCHGVGPVVDCARSAGFQVRETFCRLARLGATTELLRRQGSAWPHQQARESIYPAIIGARRYLRFTLHSSRRR